MHTPSHTHNWGGKKNYVLLSVAIRRYMAVTWISSRDLRSSPELQFTHPRKPQRASWLTSQEEKQNVTLASQSTRIYNTMFFFLFLLAPLSSWQKFQRHKFCLPCFQCILKLFWRLMPEAYWSHGICLWYPRMKRPLLEVSSVKQREFHWSAVASPPPSSLLVKQLSPSG